MDKKDKIVLGSFIAVAAIGFGVFFATRKKSPTGQPNGLDSAAPRPSAEPSAPLPPPIKTESTPFYKIDRLVQSINFFRPTTGNGPIAIMFPESVRLDPILARIGDQAIIKGTPFNGEHKIVRLSVDTEGKVGGVYINPTYNLMASRSTKSGSRYVSKEFTNGQVRIVKQVY